ncbi:CDK2-associated and cullin domain-containing protein 1-like isoform X1 [Homarus americanus]|uniref:CDK2-associated and cullin domain-containing protein 1-like isoform X1 n=1 Tax=Homarus americanus TaxID=6706 RepID=UPI001C4758F0|nr:CDK2-associated and cullin domain-containing protein 1-like isoform X1 [Homarus americanus]
MEETMTSTSPDHHQHIADVPKRALAMTSMTNEDYRNTYWPQLQTAIDRLLQGPPPPHHTGPVIEFEPMYSAAYKCVCQQHSEALYNDLMSHVHKHFVKVAEEMQQLDEFQLIDNYYCVIHRVMYSLDGIIPIFTYLNKVYVSTKLSSNLRTELQTLFCTDVIDPVIEKLMAMVKQTTEMTPFTIAPHVLASLIKSLHKLNQAYAQKYPQMPHLLQQLKNYSTILQGFNCSNGFHGKPRLDALLLFSLHWADAPTKHPSVTQMSLCFAGWTAFTKHAGRKSAQCPVAFRNSYYYTVLKTCPESQSFKSAFTFTDKIHSNIKKLF